MATIPEHKEWGMLERSGVSVPKLCRKAIIEILPDDATTITFTCYLEDIQFEKISKEIAARQ